MRPRLRSPRRPAVERLESRSLLAGNVLVSVVAGDLIVRGDNLDNAFQITPAGAGAFRVVGQVGASGQPTLVNGGAEFTATGVTRDLRLDTREGHDQVMLRNPGDAAPPLAVARNLVIRTGGGNDEVRIFRAQVNGRLDVATKAGTDAVEVHDSQVMKATTLDLGAGDDELDLDGSRAVKALTVRAGSGNDTLTPGGGEAWDAALFDLGAGDDTLKLPAMTLRRAVTIAGGAGADDISLAMTVLEGRLQVDGGAGDDQVTLGPATLAGGPATIRGGAGDDAVYVGDVMAGTLVADTALIDLGAGADSVDVRNANFHRRVRLLGRGGDDRFSSYGTTYTVAAEVDGGGGTDALDAGLEHAGNGNIGPMPMLTSIETMLS